MRYVNLNGTVMPAAEARVPLFDHGLLYGDGLFETLRVMSGQPCWLEAHLDRLEESAGRLLLELPWSRAQLADAMQRTLQANGVREAALRLTVTRGEGPPVPDPTGCGPSSFFITLREPPPASPGISACFAGRHPRWSIPGLKSLSYQPFVIARAEARRRGFGEALLCVGDEVVEGSTTNLFCLRDGVLRTPGLESGCLPGIMRKLVLDLARDLQFEVCAATLPQGELFQSSEIFLSSSLAGILPVLQLEEARVGDGAPGPVTRKLSAALDDLQRARYG